jgi:acyl carrier protein
VTQQEIFEELQSIFTPYLSQPGSIEMDSELFHDLAINSVDYVNILMEIEDTFECTMEDDVHDIRTVKDIVQYILQLRSAAQ